MLQDSEGFMWFGTQDGLNKYDGYGFEIFKPDPADPASLSHNEIWCLYQDRGGVLWVGTRGGGLNRFNAAEKTFTHYTHRPGNPSGLSNNMIWFIHEDRSGRFWVGSEGGLDEFDRENEVFHHYTANPAAPGGLSSNYLTCFHEDRSGFYWIGTDGGGLNRFDLQTRRFTVYRSAAGNASSLDSDYIYAIREDRKGMLWIGTSIGLNRFEPATGRVTRFPFPTGGAATARTHTVNAMHLVNLGNEQVLWIGTDGGGLKIFNPETRTFTALFSDAGEPAGLSSNYIYSLYEDHSGVIWVGTEGGGLNKTEKQKEAFLHYRHCPGDPGGLNENKVWAIHEDNEGILWVGTYSGLNRLDRRSGTYTHYIHDPGNPASLSGNRVTAIHEDNEGILWVGTYRGLNRFDRRTGKFTRYRLRPGDPSSLSNNLVWTISRDSRGYMWLGTFNGLNRLDPGTGRFTRYTAAGGKPGTLSNNDVYIVYPDREGRLWIGTNGGGLNLFHRDTETFTSFQADAGKPGSLGSNSIWSILEDRGGTLWIGANGGGLNRFEPGSGTFIYYTEKDGLPNNVIYGILEDEAGHLWLSTNNGLSRFNPKTGAFKNYDVEDNIQSNEFNAGAYFKSKSGEMFFGGINGFNAFFPAAISGNPYPPRMAITGLKVLNKPVAIGEPGEIHLTTRDDIFTLTFSALHFAAPQQNRYACKLEGFHREYAHLGTNREITFSHLEPGEYVFNVKGSNNDGVWSEEPARLKILIRPGGAEHGGNILFPWLVYPLSLLAAFGAAALVFMLWKKKKARDPAPEPTTSADIAGMEDICRQFHISNREQEVIRLLVRGKSNREIADELYISFYTAKNHIRNIYKKLNVKNRVALIHFFRQHE
jgi:ligand-binding sensor domain-containing protein/DNA-binding CsgD family transcriptional regulator